MINEMPVKICPRCQQAISRMPGTGDFNHDCTPAASESLRNEDVLVTGPWTDYTGSDSSVSVAMMQGVENTLGQTRAALEGAKNWPRTSRGFPQGRYRTRRHIENIDSEYFKNKTTGVDNPETYDE